MMCLTSFGSDLIVPVFHSNPMPLNNEFNLDTLVINRKKLIVGRPDLVDVALRKPLHYSIRRIQPRDIN